MKFLLYHWREMRLGLAILLAMATVAAVATTGCRGKLFQQYEYEEEMYLSLDGSVTVYVNTSIAALNALHGTAFDSRANARVDREAIRAYFSSPVTEVVGSVRTSRRDNRRFVHVRVDAKDVTKLAEAPPFNWSSYRFTRTSNPFVFQQTVGPPASGPTAAPVAGPSSAASTGPALAGSNDAEWAGNELVAFRIHVPSKVVWHNAGPENLRRGNILVWEQSLLDRIAGKPLTIEARMETESILYRTLWLFAGTVIAVAIGFAVVIWLVVRRGAAPASRT